MLLNLEDIKFYEKPHDFLEEDVRDALKGISQEKAMLIELNFFGGLTKREISDKTGINYETVKKLIRVGLIEMRDFF